MELGQVPLPLIHEIVPGGCVRCHKALTQVQQWNHAKYCSEDCSNKHKQELKLKSPVYSECPICGELFIVRSTRQRFCKQQCARKQYRRNGFAENGRDRAKKFKVSYEFIAWIKVMERDGWTCQLCGRKTPKKLRGTLDPRAPEVDHIIPISKGGSHIYANVQCACRECNAWKLDRPLGQMRLAGGILRQRIALSAVSP